MVRAPAEALLPGYDDKHVLCACCGTPWPAVQQHLAPLPSSGEFQSLVVSVLWSGDPAASDGFSAAVASTGHAMIPLRFRHPATVLFPSLCVECDSCPRSFSPCCFSDAFGPEIACRIVAELSSCTTMKEQQIALERRVRPSLLLQCRSCRVRSALEISSSGPVGIALVSGALQASVALAGMQVRVGLDWLNEKQLRARFNAQPDDPAWQQCLPMAFVAALWDSDPVAAPGAGKAAGGGSSGKKGRSGPQGPVAQLKAELKRMQSQGTLRAPSAILGHRVRFVPSVVAQALLSATDTASGMGGEGHDASTSAASAALAVAGSVVSSGGGSGGGPFAAEPSAALSAGLVPRLEYLVSWFGCGSIWASWESAASLGAAVPKLLRDYRSSAGLVDAEEDLADACAARPLEDEPTWSAYVVPHQSASMAALDAASAPE